MQNSSSSAGEGALLSASRFAVDIDGEISLGILSVGYVLESNERAYFGSGSMFIGIEVK